MEKKKLEYHRITLETKTSYFFFLYRFSKLGTTNGIMKRTRLDYVGKKKKMFLFRANLLQKGNKISTHTIGVD